jgi:hypothetical protein
MFKRKKPKSSLFSSTSKTKRAKERREALKRYEVEEIVGELKEEEHPTLDLLTTINYY